MRQPKGLKHTEKTQCLFIMSKAASFLSPSLLWLVHVLYSVLSSVYISVARTRTSHWHTDSRGVPHCEVNVAVWQWCDDTHRGLHFVSVGDKTWRVIGQAHTVPFPCKLKTHTHTHRHRNAGLHVKGSQFGWYIFILTLWSTCVRKRDINVVITTNLGHEIMFSEWLLLNNTCGLLIK